MLTLRASSIGGCVRGYVMDLRTHKPGPTPKQQIYFAVGKALEPVIMMASGRDPGLLLDDKLEIEVPVDQNIVITGHPDALEGGWVIECKTMKTQTFKRILADGFEKVCPQYMIQGSVYCKGVGARGVKFVCFDKNDSLVHEIGFEDWELAQHFERACRNAEKIARWLPKDNLPGKEEDLPYYHCLPTYCDRHDCRFNLIHKEAFTNQRQHNKRRRNYVSQG